MKAYFWDALAGRAAALPVKGRAYEILLKKSITRMRCAVFCAAFKNKIILMLAMSITSRFTIAACRPLRAAALPAIAAHIVFYALIIPLRRR